MKCISQLEIQARDSISKQPAEAAAWVSPACRNEFGWLMERLPLNRSLWREQPSTFVSLSNQNTSFNVRLDETSYPWKASRRRDHFTELGIWPANRKNPRMQNVNDLPDRLPEDRVRLKTNGIALYRIGNGRLAQF
jgi:hypothetical protein